MPTNKDNTMNIEKEITKMIIHSGPFDTTDKLILLESLILNIFLKAKQAPEQEALSSSDLLSDGRYVYAYADIKDIESSLGYPVNEAFKSGWRLGRMTKKQLEAMTGKDESDNAKLSERLASLK